MDQNIKKLLNDNKEKRVMLQVRLPQSIVKIIDDIRKGTTISRAELVNDILERHLRNKK